MYCFWYRYNFEYIVLSFCRKWSKSFTAVSQPSDCHPFFSSAATVKFRWVSGERYDSLGWKLHVDITSKHDGKSEWVDMYTLHLYSSNAGTVCTVYLLFCMKNSHQCCWYLKCYINGNIVINNCNWTTRLMHYDYYCMSSAFW